MNDDQYQISIATSCQKITEIKSVVVKQHDAIPTYYLAIIIHNTIMSMQEKYIEAPTYQWEMCKILLTYRSLVSFKKKCSLHHLEICENNRDNNTR